MKKMIYILSLLFVILLTSCEVESSDSSYPRTAQARNAFDYVEKSLSQSVILLDLITKVSYYSEVSEEKKEGIKNYFLASYSITNTANSWILKNEYQEITLTHNNKTINEVDAIWTTKVITKLLDGTTQTSVEDKNYKVQSLGNRIWKINTFDFSFYGYYQNEFTTSAELNISGSDSYEKSRSIYAFKIEKGSGITKINTSKLTYDILQPTIYSTTSSSANLTALNGEIQINIDDQKDKINAEITSSDYYPRIKITYKGITETY